MHTTFQWWLIKALKIPPWTSRKSSQMLVKMIFIGREQRERILAEWSKRFEK